MQHYCKIGKIMDCLIISRFPSNLKLLVKSKTNKKELSEVFKEFLRKLFESV